MEGLLPPYTQEERSRELSMRSRALRWRAQRICTQSKRLRDESETLLIKLSAIGRLKPSLSMYHPYALDESK